MILTCQTDNIKGLALYLCGEGFLGSVKERTFVHLHTNSVNITAASLWPWEDAPIPRAWLVYDSQEPVLGAEGGVYTTQATSLRIPKN